MGNCSRAGSQACQTRISPSAYSVDAGSDGAEALGLELSAKLPAGAQNPRSALLENWTVSPPKAAGKAILSQKPLWVRVIGPGDQFAGRSEVN
nr:hypothetical protein [uncultured Halomonas sp.]